VPRGLNLRLPQPRVTRRRDAHPPRVPNEEVLAITGLWRDAPGSKAVLDDQHVVGVHNRMPVILKRADWADWLDGPPDAACLLCRPYPELMVC
jgi:putative SOS response-associated peptidase YedK